ncbi:NAD(P)-dependent oxidoreductase [Paralimibaculum aggregatum]|uniref:NAD(P)-dependent oxidoreductase n=1 Tax=Paralimibaculum aggregatum TaxID=3036245 RepID=A0ABQ6LPU2_9RHOB|nr:NAD(P)-dependent oxidoreductase [Limibaculum sp. NKW23]GMG84626.1 NAD(P)-dependent oxidoreductase [Limibaculum sp. NKW23]
MKVGFIGLGAMGGRMAAVLAGAGHGVAGFDLSSEALARLEAAGGIPVSSAASAAAGAEALVLMVVNAAQAETVLWEAGTLAALPEGALVISCVTMPPADAARIAGRVEAEGRRFLDAPVSGGSKGAETGTLTFMVGGAPADLASAQPLLEAMGRHVFHMGENAGAGSTMKMVHQLAAGANLAVAAEVMSFGAHLGLAPAQLLEVLNVSAGGSWMIADRGPRMMEAGTEARSAVDIFVKDLGIVTDAGRAARFPLPVSAAALQVFLGASGAGFGGHDDSQAVRFYEALGGRRVRRGD